MRGYTVDINFTLDECAKAIYEEIDKTPARMCNGYQILNDILSITLRCEDYMEPRRVYDLIKDIITRNNLLAITRLNHYGIRILKHNNIHVLAIANNFSNMRKLLKLSPFKVNYGEYLKNSGFCVAPSYPVKFSTRQARATLLNLDAIMINYFGASKAEAPKI